MKQQLLKTFLVFLVLFTTQETFSQNNILTLVNVIQKGTTDPNSKAKFTVTYKNTGSVTTDITGKPFQFRRQKSGSADQVTGYISIPAYEHTSGTDTKEIDLSFTWPLDQPALSNLPDGEYYELRLFNAGEKDDYELADRHDHFPTGSVSPGTGAWNSATGWMGLLNVEVVFATASNDKHILENVNIYPNPAKDNLSIEAPLNSTFELFDVTGTLVKASSVSNSTKISVNDVKSGIYFAKISNAGKSATIKIVIE